VCPRYALSPRAIFDAIPFGDLSFVAGWMRYSRQNASARVRVSVLGATIGADAAAGVEVETGATTTDLEEDMVFSTFVGFGSVAVGRAVGPD
jgi:hypothetical protein